MDFDLTQEVIDQIIYAMEDQHEVFLVDGQTGQIVPSALPASAQTPGSVFIENIAAAIAQSTALPPHSAISAAASAANAEVVATAILVAVAGMLHLQPGCTREHSEMYD